MEDKRLIEVDFPLKEVSEESVREKNIRHGHISTLHIWWARRPLAASRATTFAALVPAPQNHDELRKKLEFVAELSKWENSVNQRIMESARKEIREFFGRAPKVLDCFAGGGAIPLEALRLGCETYALEYNPVAVLILKAMFEYPQKFGKCKDNVKEGLRPVSNSLIEEVKKWGDWVLGEARKEIGKFYPPDPDGSVPIGYIWARTIKCQNPSCGAEIPIMRQLWLCKKEKSKIALKIIVDRKSKTISFEIVKDREINFDPSKGTTRKTTVQCPICYAGIDGKTLRKEAQKGKIGERLVAVVLRHPHRQGKIYRVSVQKDQEIFKEAERYLKKKRQELFEKWGFNPVPDEPIPTPNKLAPPHPRGTFFVHLQPVLLGMSTWGDLFNTRQKLALVTFIEKVRCAYEEMRKLGYNEEYARAVVTYLSMAIDKLACYINKLTRWNVSSASFAGKPDQDSNLPMRWDYASANPFSNITGSWNNQIKSILSVLSNLCIPELASKTSVAQGSATNLSEYQNEFFDAVITDPPYYDNEPYSDLSDFFYVILKRTIGDAFPEIFSTPLSPRSQECIQNISLVRKISNINPKELCMLGIKDKEFFETTLTQAFSEIYCKLKPEGIACIVFAHKSTEAWESIINALLNSGLYLTASWPLNTERKARQRAQESAALASSIYMVCRKRVANETAYFNEIKSEIDRKIKEKLTQFWEQGISGADFFVSAIGSAVEVFGKYSKVEKLSGEEVSVPVLLEYVRKVVSEFALERVLKRADLGGVDAETRFYLLWRWTFGNAKVHFDDAIKLSRPMGVELTELWDGGSLVKKEKEFVRVLTPQERAKDPAFLKKTKFTSIIDVLHHVLALWERGEREKIKEVLNETGYAGNEIFWQTAQAISEILPQGDKEKQLLQGFLYGKEIYVKEARGKTSLLDYMESK
jgi:adenine-specific DNA methylase